MARFHRGRLSGGRDRVGRGGHDVDDVEMFMVIAIAAPLLYQVTATDDDNVGEENTRTVPFVERETRDKPGRVGNVVQLY